MNRKTIILLIAHILVCLAGMAVGILGFVELFDKGFVLTDNVARIPVAIAMLLSGIFTFTVVFTNGTDYETWEKLK